MEPSELLICWRQVGDTPATFIEAPEFGESSSVRVAVTEPKINPSTSEVEDPQSDDDVPCFSDVEAMVILDASFFKLILSAELPN